MDYPAPLQRLIDELRALPGIGPKSAQRIAFHLLKGSREDAQRLSAAVVELLDSIRTCTVCNAVTDAELCATCADAGRSDRIICVVEEPHNLLAVERTRDFKGRYHVLQGVLLAAAGDRPRRAEDRRPAPAGEGGRGGRGHPGHQPHHRG
jgi:recombination protein RecR